MAEARNRRLLRTAVGIVVGFLLMWAAVALAYQGVLWFQSSQRLLGIVVILAVGLVLEVDTHVIGVKTRGLGRGIIIGLFAGMIVQGGLPPRPGVSSGQP